MAATSAGARPPAAPPSTTAQQPPAYTDGYKRLVLGLLVTAYTLNFIDRTIIATIGQAIKVDLKITDTQLGLLGGLYFALLYTLLGIPIARLAERYSRVNIIAVAVVVWSGFTALCGTATSFAQLALYRFGVGVGEAGCSPPAHSLISDYFEPRKRASALAVYSFGIPLGTMFGALAGGWLAQTFSWRVAFLLVGLPGIAIAIAIKLLMKEPPRGHSEPQSAPAAGPKLDEDVTPEARGEVAEPPVQISGGATPASLKGELSEIWAVVRILFGTPAIAHMVIGVTLASFAAYGVGQFAPPYFIRSFGLNYAEVGAIVGLVAGFSAGIGTLAGGFVADRLARRSERWYALTPAIGLAVCAPLYLWAYHQPSWQLTVALLIAPGILHYVYLGPTFGVVQNMVDTRRRATATAILFFFLNLIALGGGPPATGWLIDRMAGFDFANPGVTGTWAALVGVFQGGVAFNSVCPGGVAPAGSGPELMARCASTLALATRQGISVTLLFYVWAAAHYFLGSLGLVKALAAARAARGESR